MTLPRAAVVGLAGTSLAPKEARLLSACPPAGIILFARNCHTRDQVKRLVDEVRALFPDRWLPILIDQEGGRVRRLKPPQWCDVPAPSAIVAAARGDRSKAASLVDTWARLLAAQLVPLGIDVDCAPVLDLVQPDTTDAIADRSFGTSPQEVGELGRAAIDTLLRCGIAPVIKHLPGHGRAKVDSHHLLPVIEAEFDTLRETDFRPFRRCAHAPFAMTAHVILRAVDAERPATQSETVIREIIRGEIGFGGILFSDDLSMEALDGPIEQRAERAVAAGCDLALHCNGKLDEMRAVLETVSAMPQDRFDALQSCAPSLPPFELDEAALADELHAVLTGLDH